MVIRELNQIRLGNICDTESNFVLRLSLTYYNTSTHEATNILLQFGFSIYLMSRVEGAGGKRKIDNLLYKEQQCYLISFESS